jgi:hypothetical protein
MTNAPMFYPDLPDQRRAQIRRDVVSGLLLVFFCWCGFQVHDTVSSLSALGEGVRSAGTAVEDGFASVGGAVEGIPIVGDDLADALDGVGAGTGGNLADLGQTGVDAVERTALLAGLAAALLPSAVLLVAVLPRRIRGIREMTAARSMTDLSLDDPEHRRLLAMRAAFGLPFRDLLPHTRDPFGDLAAGRYDALVAAALAEVGLSPVRPPSR